MLPIKKYFKHPERLGESILERFFKWLPDKTYIKLLFRFRMGYKLDLDNPQTFCEKLQWLKLYNCRPEYTQMVDKYAVKDYVAKIIGEEYIIPTLGVWDKPEEIEWDKLPDKFVLKTTHGGGSSGVVICKDKSSLDKEKAMQKLRKNLMQDNYRKFREWPYKNVPRRVIAEHFIDNGNEDLRDYKYFCFNGEPKYCQVISGRETIECSDFFDYEWNHQLFHEPKHLPFSEIELKKPNHLEEMWSLASKLAKDKPFSRIDFYDVGENVYFGEITFFPTTGLGGFVPKEYDKVFGEMITLPK